MAVLMVTKDRGGTSQPTSMTVVPPSQAVPISALMMVGQKAGVNGPALADTVSAFTMHERSAARFGMSAAQQTSRADLRQLHEALANAHQEYLAVLEAMMQAIGLNPLYVSPAARMAAYLDERLMQAPLLAGSVDLPTLEIFQVVTAFLMTQMSGTNAQTLAVIASQTGPSDLRNALGVAAQRLGGEVIQALELVRAVQQDLILGHVLSRTR